MGPATMRIHISEPLRTARIAEIQQAMDIIFITDFYLLNQI